MQWDAADYNQGDANNGVVVMQGLAYVDDTFTEEVGYFSRTTLAVLP